MCVHESKFCNGVNDCTDSTDELFCNIECDADKEFKCHSPPYCIFKKWQCDGERDCSDGSDEKNCTKSICPKGEFSCKNSDSSSSGTACINSQWICDGEDDCGDGSDEASDLCLSRSCEPNR